MYRDRDNAQLWDDFLSGDLNAYKKLYDENIDDLFRFGMQFSNDRELVKDCIQDVFVALYNKRTKLGHVSHFKAYVLSSLKNAIINSLKRRINLIKYNRLIGINDIEPITPELSLICREEEHLLQDKLDGILSILSPRQREVMFYRFIENMSINDIALILQVEKQSIQNIIQRSIKKVKRHL